jgi:hypothetical protein
MPEMPDHDLRTTIDALCARLQSDLQTQAAQFVDRVAEDREAARRETETRAAEEWAARVEAVREEWNGRLQVGLADATADADRRVAAEAERMRLEVERQAREADQAAERHRKEIETVRDEWQGRLQAALADATEEADRRVIAETDRIRREVEAAAAESAERAREEVRRDMEQAANASTAQLRVELEQAATHSTTRLREELEQAAAHATARLRTEMEHAVATERDRAGAELEAERVRARALAAALEEAQAALPQEREAARQAVASLEALQAEQRGATGQAVIDARVAERQAQLAAVERLLAAVRTIGGARSLSDTLTGLTDVAATIAPRAALFIVVNRADGQELQGWHAAGFADNSPKALRLSSDDRAGRGLLDLAVSSGRAVSTPAEPAPAFARLPQDRAGLAVPITVGGQSVAVLYADDASAAEPEAPASWPEAIQVLAAHASACLEQITAVRTTQAIQQMASTGAKPATAAAAAGSPAHEHDSSARRYARLLVSEIKLYNEAAVRTGREKRDLLNRLAPEIERARRLYEERVPASVVARGAYFQQELVHTLADGDSALLGGAA